MARSPRSTATATAVTAPSTPAQTASAATGTAKPTANGSGRASRRKQSIAPAPAPTPAQSAANPVAGPSNGNPASSPKAQPPSRQPVEAKAHALRSVHGAGERAPCPFPEKYGGKDKCGVADDDESDEVLMAACAACAEFDNRALSPDEIAQVAFQQGWLRPPSAAIEPASVISASIRSHLKRCEKADPKRTPLLAKWQLLGAAAETALESALCPGAFDGPVRPKGPVFYLATVGKMKWRDPFEGIEIPKAPPRKPAAPRKIAKDTATPSATSRSTSGSGTKEAKKVGRPRTSQASTPTPAAAPVKIRLVLNAPASSNSPPEDADMSDVASSAGQMSRSTSSVGIDKEGTPMPIAKPKAAMGKQEKRRLQRRTDLDTDDSSDSASDSEMELDGPIRTNVNARTGRRIPPPLSLAGTGSRYASQNRIHHPSPYLELFLDPLTAHPVEPLTPTGPPVSAFPSHSLDNSTWIMRNDTDRFAAFETSSSSSDDDLRDSEWGRDSGVVIRSEDDMRGDDDLSASMHGQPWTMDDEEGKVKEATEALRVLFPMSSPDEAEESSSNIQLNQLDNNRPAPSDSSSVAESSGTVSLHTLSRGLRRSDTGPAVALNAWVSDSSPIPSPSIRASFALPPAPDSSPTQHLSKLHSSFESDAMEIDDDDWLSESGELPVHADETLSDIDLTSTVGDVCTPENERHLETAEWAREAAVATSSSYQVKEELLDDYPSPLTELDDSVRSFHTRASSIDSHTLSSGSSADSPPFDMDGDNAMRLSMDEDVVAGPESVTLDEIDGWMPLAKGEKTPRGRGKGRNPAARCPGGPWASLGNFAVGATLCAVPAKLAQAAQAVVKSPKTRSRSIRTSLRRRDSSCASRRSSKAESAVTAQPEADAPVNEETEEQDTLDAIEIDAIGPADLEAARAEAESKEEQYRQACREKAEQQRAMLEALRQGVLQQTTDEASKERSMSMSMTSTALSTPTTWHDLSHWPSMESLSIATPGGALSPLALHSMSTLSLADMPYSMDPKALLSPHMQPLSASPVNMEISPKPQPQPRPIASTSTTAPAAPGSTAKGRAAAAKQSKASANAASAASLPKLAPAPQPIAPASNIPPAIVKQEASQPASQSNAAKPSAAPKSNAKAGKLGVPAAVKDAEGKVSPSPSTTSAASAPAALRTTGTTAGSTPASGAATPTTAPALPPPPPPVEREKKSTPLCPGVVACVMDNIPVYAHIYDHKGVRAVLLRRLDTDFVNGTSLLMALGVPVTRHADYLTIPSPWLPSHHHVPPTGDGGIAHVAGVPGLWIPFQAAKELAKRCRMADKSVLSNILRDDLFSLFATIANLNTTHSPSETFGLPFVAGAAPSAKNSGARSQANNGNANGPNASFAASSANSRSTPNLTALGTSAPARSMTPAGLSMTAPGTPVNASAPTAPGAQNKGPLVRAAPAQPEGCPQPKRRRATIVGASPLKAAPVAPLTAGSTPITPVTSAPAVTGARSAAAPGAAPASSQPGPQPKPSPQAVAAAQPTPPPQALSQAVGQLPKDTPAGGPQTPRRVPATATPSPAAPPVSQMPAAKTAAARRATRASIGGSEAARPKAVK